MKCIKCRTKNITKANYCKRCAYKFSEVEQKAARKKTFIGKIEILENAYNVCTLKKFTGHILFKIGSLLIVLIIGISFWVKDGINLKLLDSDNYDIYYNVNEKEYYLQTNNDKVLLNLYVPNRTEEIIITHYTETDEQIEEKKYSPKDEIILETMEKEYYVLNINYLHDDKESFKFYVLQS